MTNWEREKNCQLKAVGIIVFFVWIQTLFTNWQSALLIFPGLYILGLVIFRYVPASISWVKKFRQKCEHGVYGGDNLNRCRKCELAKFQIERSKEIETNIRREILKKERADAEFRKMIERKRTELLKNESDRIRQYLNLNFENLTNVNPYEFETLIGTYFKAKGYEVYQTQRANDGGRDLILKNEAGKIIVECKRYSEGSKIGRPTIQKFHSAVITDQAIKGVIVTTSDFTNNAYSYPAVKNGLIELINREKLKELLLAQFGVYKPVFFRDVCQTCGNEFDHSFSGLSYCENGHEFEAVSLDDLFRLASN